MYCINCGTHLRDEARFCAQCGSPIRSVETYEPDIQWEELEIEYRDDGLRFGASLVNSVLGVGSEYGLYFVARMLGPYGETRVDLAPLTTFSTDPLEMLSNPSDRKYAQEVLQRINQEILAQGWEPRSRGQWWFSYRYRRPYDEKWDAFQLLDDLRNAGARIKPAAQFSDMQIEGVELTPETKTQLDRLKPALMKLLMDEYGISESDLESQWETCEIHCLLVEELAGFRGRSALVFQAEAVGPNGSFVAAKIKFQASANYAKPSKAPYIRNKVPYYIHEVTSQDKKAVAAHATLTKELTSAGWKLQPLPWEEPPYPYRWYATHFRRLAK